MGSKQSKPTLFYVANASNYIIEVGASKQQTDQMKSTERVQRVGVNAQCTAKICSLGGAYGSEKKVIVSDVPSAASSASLAIGDILLLDGNYVNVMLKGINGSMGGCVTNRYPVQDNCALIITRDSTIQLSSAINCSAYDDEKQRMLHYKQAWVDQNGRNHRPLNFYVANAHNSEILVDCWNTDTSNEPKERRSVECGDVEMCLGDKVRIYMSNDDGSESQIYEEYTKPRTSLIVTSKRRVVISRQLQGNNIADQLWEGDDGFCWKPEQKPTAATAPQPPPPPYSPPDRPGFFNRVKQRVRQPRDQPYN